MVSSFKHSERPTERGKFLILEEMGRGGMGVVYLAEDAVLGRKVALKILRAALSEDAEFVARFRREARAIANLSHPNIIGIHSLEEVDGRLAIDMEYAEGGCLMDRMDSPLPVGQAVRVVRDVLDALAACHARELVHRDVKPSNILFSANGRAMLADFGLATAGAECMEEAIKLTASTSVVLGTPRYAPMEAWDGAVATPAWDVYSVGIILYEALSGAPAITGETPLAIIKELLKQPLRPINELLPELSKEFTALLESMVARDPAQRPPDAGAALARLLETPEAKGLDHAHTLPPMKRRRMRIPRRWRAAGMRWLSLATVLVCVVLGVALLITAQNQAVLPLQGPAAPGMGSTAASPQEALLNTPRVPGGPAPLFFDTSCPETSERITQHWMMALTATGGAQIVAAGNREWWGLRMETSGAGLEFSGDWAGYDQQWGGPLAYGVVSGKGEWMDEGQSLVAALEFKNVRDNSILRRSLTARRSSPDITDTRFFYRAEEANALLPLLYRELLPRHMAWALDIERQFPALPGIRCEVPLLTDTPMDFAVDGRLDEPVWQTIYFNRFGRIGRLHSGADGVTLRGRALASALLLALEAHGAPESPCLVEVVMFPNGELPFAQAPVYGAAFMDGQLLDSSRVQNGREQPWGCDWKCAAQISENGALSVELAFPREGMGLGPFSAQMPSWRMNISVSQTGANGARERVCHWGVEDLNAVHHGVLMHFEQPTDKREAQQ